VEMTETANILNNATGKSLVLMDEVGRGTSTFDGLSLAWASAKHLAEKSNSYTLFATHYFEMTHLPDLCSGTKNVHLDATEHGDHLIFMHAVQEGPASQSYGLQVAKLAGVPREVIDQASNKLDELEAQESGLPSPTSNPTNPAQGDMFAADLTHPVVDSLSEVDPNDLTPKQALELIYQLKSKL